MKNTLAAKISVVTPTFLRPVEIAELLSNLSRQTLLPFEVIIVDGAPAEEQATADLIGVALGKFPFQIKYLRHAKGTAIQRNAGIEAASGDFIALIDDDVRLDSNFLREIITVFEKDLSKNIGGIVGYRRNKHFALEDSQRWRWYKRLNLLTTYEPGKYDFRSGYPVNNNLQPPFRGVREVDFMTTACTVWRREVFAEGLRFHRFFTEYGVLEDAHFALRAGKNWRLLQCGDALCEELHSPRGRSNRRSIGYKCVVNYYFVFQDIVKPLSTAGKIRFWRYQLFELLRIFLSALRRRRIEDLQEIAGRIQGFLAVFGGRGFHFENAEKHL